MQTRLLRETVLPEQAGDHSAFPVAVTAFEHFMLADDRPSHPMTPFVRLTFIGRLDRQRFQNAVHIARYRHPLLRAHLRGPVAGKTSELAWVDAGHQKPFIHWDAEGVGLIFPGQRWIDPRSEVGIRFWAREGGNRTALWIQFHHACCDILGLMRFVEDLLETYHYLPGSPPRPKLPTKFLAEQLVRRGEFPQSLHRSMARLPKDLARLLAFYRRTPLPLAGATPPLPNHDSVPYPALHTHFFSKEELQRLQACCKSLEVTLNDLLLRDFFLALNRWCSGASAKRPSRLLRVGMPINLRTASDGNLSAANKVSLVFLDRRGGAELNPAGLLKSVRRETQDVKHWNMGMTLIHLLNVLGRFRGGVSQLVRSESCLSSTGFSNPGVVLAHSPLPRQEDRIVVGGAILDGVEVCAPLRPGTSVVFAATTYAGRLNICMHYDHRVFTANSSRQLFRSLVAQVSQSLSHAPADRSLPTFAQPPV